jgi:hypothetical protein
MGGCKILTLAPVGMSPNGRILVVRRAHGDDKKAQIAVIHDGVANGSNWPQSWHSSFADRPEISGGQTSKKWCLE